MLSMLPEARAGLDCDRDQPGCAVPTNTPIELEFDRPLYPTTVNRQAISVFVTEKAPYSPFLSPEYDLLTRRVRFHMSGALQPSVLYHLKLPISVDRSVGFRAYDGAALADDLPYISTSFFTASGPSPAPAPVPTFAEPGCADVVEVLASACASGCCHAGDSPAMGLKLDDADALVETAVSRVAHQAETGNSVGVGSAQPLRFGVSMRLIDPGRSYSSYLIYKLLLDEQNHAPCTGDCRFAALPGAAECLPLTEEEQTRMAGWFVQGEPMPMSGPAAALLACDELPPRRHLDCGALRAVSRWIDSGAKCP
ncbi:MAG: Ig-like domain-containing protein [Polyangiaceae bacterium]